jgi:DNA-binding PadR family transcriptional regulator
VSTLIPSAFAASLTLYDSFGTVAAYLGKTWDAVPDTLWPVSTERELGPGEWAVLALLSEAPGHGWILATQLSRTGAIGKVWTLGRPLVYRAIETLEGRGLIAPIGEERGARGPNRTIFSATPAGREALLVWLHAPVEHVRDVRSLFLLKLVLLQRAGQPLQSLLKAERLLVEPAIASLETRLETSPDDEAIFLRFRLETTRAVLAFIDALLHDQARVVSSG